ncbi:MAG TPA: hypothetical protein VH561_09805 [Micromonosporaceae bacterium]|jgi:hypothetical protein
MSRHYVTNAPVLDRTVSRPVVVVDDFARLHGPAAGVVTLPTTLNWTPRTRYDLANEIAARSLYQVVLREARAEDQIETYLNPDLLRRLWPSLTLPRPVREFWEAQHPALASN